MKKYEFYIRCKCKEQPNRYAPLLGEPYYAKKTIYAKDAEDAKKKASYQYQQNINKVYEVKREVLE